VHPGHAQQTGIAVDLGAARPAAAGLAVPAQREVARLAGLDAVEHVEHDLALVRFDLVVQELTDTGFSSPDAQGHGCCHQPSFTKASRSAGITGSGSRVSDSSPSRRRMTMLTVAS